MLLTPSRIFWENTHCINSRSWSKRPITKILDIITNNPKVTSFNISYFHIVQLTYNNCPVKFENYKMKTLYRISGLWTAKNWKNSTYAMSYNKMPRKNSTYAMSHNKMPKNYREKQRKKDKWTTLFFCQHCRENDIIDYILFTNEWNSRRHNSQEQIFHDIYFTGTENCHWKLQMMW